jgi:folylpolyglutamate synthase/dihydropteroate synthase
VASATAKLGLPVEVTESVAEGVRLALERADPEDMLLVTGSLYVVGAARSVLVHEADR